MFGRKVVEFGYKRSFSDVLNIVFRLVRGLVTLIRVFVRSNYSSIRTSDLFDYTTVQTNTYKIRALLKPPVPLGLHAYSAANVFECVRIEGVENRRV